MKNMGLVSGICVLLWPNSVTFQQKEPLASYSRELQGMDFSVNDQFPREIMERHKVLFPFIPPASLLHVFLSSPFSHCTDRLFS